MSDEGSVRVKISKEGKEELQARVREHMQKYGREKGLERPIERMDEIVSSISGVPEDKLKKTYKLEIEE